jgi:hypothetical protein
MTGGADSVLIRLPAGAGAAAAGAGRLMPKAPPGVETPFTLRCTGRACDGRSFTITMSTRAPVDWTVVGVRDALPPEGRALQAARPADARPQFGTDAALVLDRFRF